MTVERYEDVSFGDELPEFTPDVSLPTVIRFTDAALMNASRFTDHEEARKSGLPGAMASTPAATPVSVSSAALRM